MQRAAGSCAPRGGGDEAAALRPEQGAGHCGLQHDAVAAAPAYGGAAGEDPLTGPLVGPIGWVLENDVHAPGDEIMRGHHTNERSLACVTAGRQGWSTSVLCPALARRSAARARRRRACCAPMHSDNQWGLAACLPATQLGVRVVQRRQKRQLIPLANPAMGVAVQRGVGTYSLPPPSPLPAGAAGPCSPGDGLAGQAWLVQNAGRDDALGLRIPPLARGAGRGAACARAGGGGGRQRRSAGGAQCTGAWPSSDSRAHLVPKEADWGAPGRDGRLKWDGGCLDPPAAVAAARFAPPRANSGK